jgi:hypothetical protein
LYVKQEYTHLPGAMNKILQRASTWKYILPLFILFFGITCFVFPSYHSRLKEIAGEEVKSLDSRFSYTMDEVRTDFEKLGVAGRSLYQSIVGGIDMVYPIVYGLFFILILANLLKKTTNPGSKFMLLAMLPTLGVLCDYLENINTLSLLRDYPHLSEQSVAWGEQMTRMKLAFLLLTLGFVLFLAVSLLVKRLKKRTGNPVAPN